MVAKVRLEMEDESERLRGDHVQETLRNRPRRGDEGGTQGVPGVNRMNQERGRVTSGVFH